ncbi:hypothetical protein HQ590_00530 [bacterium]|nr:hypothetical protein [bacterium]
MKGWLIGIVLAGLVTYGGIQVASILTAKSDLARRVERHLDFVDENSSDSVREDLVREAQRLGIELNPGDIHIIYRDTERQSYPQRVVGGIADFTNKRVEITLRYEASFFGLGWSQEVAASKIRQIQVRRKSPSPEYEELLR